MMSIPITLLAAVLLLLLLETLSLARMRRAIPVRILVLGSRGKTTVTEHIAGILRASGRRTLAKTTGTRPVLILPDGCQQRLRRRGKPRIQEQIRMIRMARRLGCDALVLECMAVSPELQRLESRILRPTLAVLTNVLDDHREVYGDNERWRVMTFASTLPARTVIVSGERRHTTEIHQAAARRGSTVIDVAPASSAEPRGAITESNLLLARAAAKQLRIATAGETLPVADPSRTWRELSAATAGPTVRILDAFAVNDTESASKFVEAWRQNVPDWERTVFLFNTRSDRPLRSLQFARWCMRQPAVQAVVLMGTHVPRTRRELLRLGFSPAQLLEWGRAEIADPREPLRRLAAPGTVFVGIANAVGDGSRLLRAMGGE